LDENISENRLEIFIDYAIIERVFRKTTPPFMSFSENGVAYCRVYVIIVA